MPFKYALAVANSARIETIVKLVEITAFFRLLRQNFAGAALPVQGNVELPARGLGLDP